jgi:hypothetical protein
MASDRCSAIFLREKSRWITPKHSDSAWNAGSVRQHDRLSQRVSRLTVLEQHTATLSTGANAAAGLAKFLRPVQ